ncbi:Autoinducer 2 import system permease protein LsrD [Castellaniella defragrans]
MTTHGRRFPRSLLATPWIWSFLGAVAVALITLIVTRGQGADSMLTTALSFSTFLVLVSIGQMLVITLGPGNIDLSIPATIGLASAVSMKVMDGSDGLILVGLAAALACGALVGVFNYALIRLLRIPPIIATLSSSFVIQSAAISYGRGLQIKPPPAFSNFTFARVAGVPVIAIVAVAVTLLVGFVLHRTIFGRTVQAAGQNRRAAWLANLPVTRTELITYTLCGLLAALAGVLLAGFSGGSSLSMGDEYLLASIAAVVIGGTSVAGGSASVPGLWGAAIFLFMISTLLNMSGLGAGLRDLMTGLIILLVIGIAGGEKRS